MRLEHVLSIIIKAKWVTLKCFGMLVSKPKFEEDDYFYYIVIVYEMIQSHITFIHFINFSIILSDSSEPSKELHN